MVVYGLELALRLAERWGMPPTDAVLRSIFERWERLHALSVVSYHHGSVPGEDSMRGHNGAVRAYANQVRTLDYRLLSRQLELGALGAYLTSCRTHGLVAQDRLRPTPLGAQLGRWM